MPFPPISDSEDFGESLPPLTESLHGRSQRKPENPPRLPSDNTAGVQHARANDAVSSVRAKFADFGMPLHDAQFADVANDVLPWAESVTSRGDYNEVMGINPRDYVTQQNWRRGVGGGIIERNFSPRARAQGHLLGAAAMFVASTPPLVGRATVNQIRY